MIVVPSMFSLQGTPWVLGWQGGCAARRSSAPSRRMPTSRFITRLRRMDWDPLHWLRLALLVTGRALTRLWGRDVMLFTGGVSFFAMLAIFPTLAILIGLFSVLVDPAQAIREGEALST